MQCPGCSKPLANGVTVCLHCGTPLPHRSDVPVAVSAFPALPDPVLPSGGHWETTSIPASPYDNFMPIQPPPPPPDLYANGVLPYPNTKSRHFRTWQTVLAVVLLLALVFGGVGVSYAFGAIPPIAVWGKVTNSPSGATAPRCALPAIDPGVPALTAIQMTTKLGKNYAPTDNTSTFSVGQTVFVTFKIATNDAGLLAATWCLENAKEAVTPYSESVKANQKSAAGYVSLTNLDPKAIGTSSVVLFWNKRVVAALTFTVQQ
jgi:hypothetical protein